MYLKKCMYYYNMSRPTVSVCTPTYNRRFFIPTLIKCFLAQTYPQSLIEWIIVDDGDEPVGDLFEGMKNVKYFYYKEKMKLGRKRNVANSKCSNDIIVYMDDDDYYPPDRIKHAVTRLSSKPKILVAGSSIMYMYYTHINKIYSLGPYGKNHATAGTFAFKRKLLDLTSYEDDAEKAEEKHFLKNYSFPLIQLDPFKTIVVISHNKNTFDKKQILGQEKRFRMKPTKFKIKNIIKNKKIREFYTQKTKEFIDNKKIDSKKNINLVNSEVNNIKNNIEFKIIE